MRPFLKKRTMANKISKDVKNIFKFIGIFICMAVMLGFFASIGIWAAVSFLKLFGIETL